MRYRTLTQWVLVYLLPTLAWGGEETEIWAISVDNDLFSPTRTDRDYTAGFALTYFGDQAAGRWNLLDRALRVFNRAILGQAGVAEGGTAVEFGLYGFTPQDTDLREVIRDDRPYSSLVYLASSRSHAIPDSRNGWTTSLTLGVLGLDLFEAGQNMVHPVVGSDAAKGWEHQVSEGGEPTFRYSIAYHDYLANSRPDSQFKLTYFGSVGYLTEAGVALVFRDGLISSPSNRFNPELGIYGERSLLPAMEGAQESYLWGGIAVKGRLYNAFLEGQFRHSNHQIARDELRHWLVEAWAGYTHTFFEDYKLSYFIRAQSSEIQGGDGDRELVWGGLVLSRSF